MFKNDLWNTSVWHHFAQCNGVEFNTFAWQVKGCLFNPRWRYKSPLALQKNSAAPLPWEVTREQLNVARQQQDFLRTMKIWLGSKTKLAFCIFLDKSARWPLNLCCVLLLITMDDDSILRMLEGREQHLGLITQFSIRSFKMDDSALSFLMQHQHIHTSSVCWTVSVFVWPAGHIVFAVNVICVSDKPALTLCYAHSSCLSLLSLQFLAHTYPLKSRSTLLNRENKKQSRMD